MSIKNQKESGDNMQQVSVVSGSLVEPEITKDKNTKIFDSFQPKAKCGNDAHLYCSQQNCKQDASICHPSCSSCIQRHPKCIQTKISSNLYKDIQDRQIQLNPDDKKILKQIQSKTNKMTDSISYMSQKLKKQFNIFGLNQTDLKITYHLLQNYDNTQKGAQLIQIMKNFSNLNIPNQTFSGNLLKKLYDTYSDSKKNWFQNSFQNFKSIVMNHKKIVMSYFQEIQQYLFDLHVKKSQTISIPNYFVTSQIVKKTQKIPGNLFTFTKDVLNIQKYLSTANLQKSSFKKIYSFNYFTNQNFSLQKNKFFEVIEDKKDLLFLIQNKHTKCFGFFTPLKFNASNEGWLKDDKQQTFLFSLDHDCSVKIINPEYTLKYSVQRDEIVIGGQPENKFQKINKICINFIPNPSASITLDGQQLKCKGMFSNSTLDFKELNGTIDQMLLKSHQIHKLQIYQLQRFQKKKENLFLSN